jgi:hypothetical protein
MIACLKDLDENNNFFQVLRNPSITLSCHKAKKQCLGPQKRVGN